MFFQKYSLVVVLVEVVASHSCGRICSRGRCRTHSGCSSVSSLVEIVGSRSCICSRGRRRTHSGCSSV